MNKENDIIRQETKDDYRAVEELTRRAFWNVYRPGCMEHYVLHRFREDPAFIPELSFVLEQDGQIVGHVMYAHAELALDGGGTLPVLTFGPICIDPALQRRGLGKLLLETTMEQAERFSGALLTEGNILFYGTCGFAPAKSRGIYYADDPEAEYFICRELRPGFLDGVRGTYKDPEGYFVCQTDPAGFARYEQSFDGVNPAAQQTRG